MDARKFSQKKVREQKCLTCYFFREEDGERNDEGGCHRQSPRPTLEIEFYKSMWPIVSEDDWCGEWKSK